MWYTRTQWPVHALNQDCHLLKSWSLSGFVLQCDGRRMGKWARVLCIQSNHTHTHLSMAVRLLSLDSAFGWQMAHFNCLLLLSIEASIYFVVLITSIWHLQTTSCTEDEWRADGWGKMGRGQRANDTYFTRQINVEMLMLFRVLNTDQRVNFSLLTVNQRQCYLQFNISNANVFFLYFRFALPSIPLLVQFTI